MHGSTWLACLCLAAGPALARQAGPPGVREVNLHGKELVIPFTLDGMRSIPVVEAKVNGKGPFKFFFDTGANTCLVDSAFAKGMLLPLGGKAVVGDATPTGGVDVDKLSLQNLEIGAAQWAGVPAITLDRQRFGAIQGVVGSLGLPIARRHLLTVDLRGRQLRLTDEALAEKGDGITDFEWTHTMPLPELEITVGGKPIRSHIDTGSPNGICIPGSLAKELKWKTAPSVIARARTVATEFEVSRGQLDGTAVVAGRSIVDPIVYSSDAFETANLGREFLQDWVVSIDQERGRVRFVSAGPPLDPSDPASLTVSKRRLGARLDLGGESVVVRGVDPGSLAEKIGLRDGDVLASVNGHALVGADTTALQDVLKTSAAFEIAIRRDGKESKVFVPAEPSKE